MLSINISELVLTAISFFLLFFLLKRFLYTPLIRRQSLSMSSASARRVPDGEITSISRPMTRLLSR